MTQLIKLITMLGPIGLISLGLFEQVIVGYVCLGISFVAMIWLITKSEIKKDVSFDFDAVNKSIGVPIVSSRGCVYKISNIEPDSLIDKMIK